MGELKKPNIEKKPKSKPIVKRSIRINVGAIFDLIEGQELPASVPHKFYESLQTEGII